MLNKTFEWLRVANPQPSSESVTARTATVKALLSELRETEDADRAADLCVAAIGGVQNRFESNSGVVKWLVTHIRSQQAAFPADVSENALELQIVAAIALGELLSQPANKHSREQKDLIAALIIAQQQFGAPTAAQHLAAVINELFQLAHAASDESASKARRRRQIDLHKLRDLEAPGDVAALWSSLHPILVDILETLETEAAKDREELELLWWLFNGHSDKLNSPINELSADDAAIVCGVEIADRVLLPPSAAVAAMAVNATLGGRKPAQIKDQALSDCVGKWTKETIAVLSPSTVDHRSFAQNHSVLFPLSWLAMTLKDSQDTQHWENEFSAKTGINPKSDASKASIARQAFWERVSLRLLDSLSTEDEE